MSILKLPDLFLLQIYFGHLSMVIRQLLVVIVVRWLLVLLQFVNGLLVFLLHLLVASSCCLIITTFLVTLNLYLLFLEWRLIRRLLHQGVCRRAINLLLLLGRRQVIQLRQELHLLRAEAHLLQLLLN